MDPNRKSESLKFLCKNIEEAAVYKVESIGNESKQDVQDLIGYYS